jgi:hypothetical protein
MLVNYPPVRVSQDGGATAKAPYYNSQSDLEFWRGKASSLKTCEAYVCKPNIFAGTNQLIPLLNRCHLIPSSRIYLTCVRLRRLETPISES